MPIGVNDFKSVFHDSAPPFRTWVSIRVNAGFNIVTLHKSIL
jgi:hypothetical protein